MALIRPMTPADAPGVHAAARDAFSDLAARQGHTHEPDPAERYEARYRRQAAAHPEGCWVAEDDGEITGAAIALLHEGIWGLSLLVVRPDRQSGGAGRELLSRALAFSERARGAIILASRDPRAVRLYVRAGFRLEPAMAAWGRPRGVTMPEGVRVAEPAEVEVTAAIDRAVRGGARVADLGCELALGARLALCGDHGYTVLRDDVIETLAARDERAARDLLRFALASAPGAMKVEGLTARQPWAVEEAVAAGLDVSADGPQLLRGDVGPFAPYLPSGRWL